MPGESAAIRAGRAFVELSADNKPLLKVLAASREQMEKFGRALTAIGAGMAAAGTAIITPLIAATKLFEQRGSELFDLAGRTGASVEALSALGYAASQTGASLGDVEVGIKKMQKLLFEAAKGSDAAAQGLGLLGLRVEDLISLSPAQQFTQIAGALNTVRDAAMRAALAQFVFGKSGNVLLPMAAQLVELTARARELNAVMTSEMAKNADALGDAIGDVRTAAGGLADRLGNALAPALTRVSEQLTSAVVGMSKFAEAHPGLTQAALILGGALVGVGTALVGVGGAILLAAPALKAVAGGLALMLSPAGLVAVAVAGVGLAFGVTQLKGESFVDKLGNAFVNFGSIVNDAFAKASFAVLNFGDIWNNAIMRAWLTLVEFVDAAWYRLAVVLPAGFKSLVTHDFTLPAFEQSDAAKELRAGLRISNRSIADRFKKFMEEWNAAEKAIDAGTRAAGGAAPQLRRAREFERVFAESTGTFNSSLIGESLGSRIAPFKDMVKSANDTEKNTKKTADTVEQIFEKLKNLQLFE